MRTLIVDFCNLYFMCKPFHIHDDVMKGKPVAITQFLVVLNSYLKNLKPDILIICDDKHSGWRREKYSEYKANRQTIEWSELDKQFENQKNKLRTILQKFPLYYFRVEQLEADDLIYLVSRKLTNDEIIILSTDGDMLQIPQKFDNVKVYHTIKKKYLDIPKYSIVRWKCLVGDGSDNIKGMYKIGQVKAGKILESAKTFNEWYNNINEEDKQLYQSMKDIIDLSRIPLELENRFDEQYNNYKFNEFDYETLDNYLEENDIKFNLRNNLENFKALKQIC